MYEEWVEGRLECKLNVVGEAKNNLRGYENLELRVEVQTGK